MLRATLGDLIYNRCKTHERGAQKKLLRKFGGFKKLSYLCIRNLKERVVGSVRRTIGVWLRWQLIETLAESM